MPLLVRKIFTIQHEVVAYFRFVIRPQPKKIWGSKRLLVFQPPMLNMRLDAQITQRLIVMMNDYLVGKFSWHEQPQTTILVEGDGKSLQDLTLITFCFYGPNCANNTVFLPGNLNVWQKVSLSWWYLPRGIFARHHGGSSWSAYDLPWFASSLMRP